MQHLLKNTRIHRLGHHEFLKAATGTTGAQLMVDMSGFEGCLFIALAGSSCGKAATTKKVVLVKGCNTTTLASFRAIDGTSSTAAWSSGSLDRKLHAIDIYRPLSTHRYLMPMAYGCSTGGIDFIAIQYGARRPGATDMWLATSSTAAPRWRSTRLAPQVLSLGATATTGSTAVSGATAP